MSKATARASNKKSPERHPAPQAAPTVSRPELLVDGSDLQFRRLVHTLFGFLGRLHTVREGNAAAIGLAGIEYTMLISIRHLSTLGDVHVRAVADDLYLSGAFVTTVTNKLMRKGLIEKVGHPVDRRRLCLTVTEAGAALLDRLAPLQTQVNDVQFDCLSAKEFQQLLGMVQRLVESSDRGIALQRYLAEVNSRSTILPAPPALKTPSHKARKA